MNKEYLYDIGIFVQGNVYESLAVHISKELGILGYQVKVISLPKAEYDPAARVELHDFIRNRCAYHVFFISKDLVASAASMELVDMAAGICKESGCVRAVAVELDASLPVERSLALHTVPGAHCTSLEAAREIHRLAAGPQVETAGRNRAEKEKEKKRPQQNIQIVMADKISHSRFF